MAYVLYLRPTCISFKSIKIQIFSEDIQRTFWSLILHGGVGSEEFTDKFYYHSKPELNIDNHVCAYRS